MKHQSCRDCGCLEGEYHYEGCDQDKCSKCGRQVLAWGRCKGAKKEPFFSSMFCCERCGNKMPNFKMVSDKEWEFICVVSYPPKCVLCGDCMSFIKKEREGMINE